jgi:hypothetical protein
MSKKYISTFFITSLFVFGCKQTTQQAKPTDTKTDSLVTIDENKWEITINNGKGETNEEFAVVSTFGLMDNYLQNVTKIDKELAYSLLEIKNYAKHFSADSLMIDSIGKWGDYAVYQISNFYVMHRSILLKYADGKYRLLYTESDHNGSLQSGTPVFDVSNGNKALSTFKIAQLFRPTIYESNGEQLLTLKYFVGGNSEYIGSSTFKLDKKTHLPKEIK